MKFLIQLLKLVENIILMRRMLIQFVRKRKIAGGYHWVYVEETIKEVS